MSFVISAPCTGEVVPTGALDLRFPRSQWNIEITSAAHATLFSKKITASRSKVTFYGEVISKLRLIWFVKWCKTVVFYGSKWNSENANLTQLDQSTMGD